MTTERTIIETLRDYHQAKWVSPFIATWRCSEGMTPLAALNDLIEAGIVERKYIKRMPLVRYVPKLKTYLRTVNNDPHRLD